MAIKEYDNEPQASMASEPAIAYVSTYPTQSVEELHTSTEQDVLAEYEETMDVEELRAMLHETVRKEYARP